MGLRYSYGTSHTYYNPHTMMAFLSDILDLCVKNSLYFVHKAKRNTVFPDHFYQSFLNKLLSHPFCISVETFCSPCRLMSLTPASISIPFTSVPHLSFYSSTPSIYYDPCNLFPPDLNSAQGVPLIQGSKSLAD